jgi:LacI family transcriptional regulator
MVTIRDVAKRADVSVATVSHVLNKTRFVSEALRKRVEIAMSELDFHPNIVASGLRTRKTGSIGLIVPDNSNPLFAELAHLIEDVMFGAGYSVVLCNSANDLARERAHIRTLRSKRVDGLIIIPSINDPEPINRLVGNDLPVVIMDRAIPGVNTDVVLVDNFMGMQEATQYLLRIGHRRIGYVDRPVDLPHSRERFLGFQRALKDANIDLPPELIVRGGFRYEDGAGAVKKLLRKRPQPTAVVFFNDISAIGALRAAVDQKMRVPEDISLIGFDDIPPCAFTIPRLTTIHFPKREMALKAGELLLRRIELGEDHPFETVTLPAHLVIRESTTKPKG